MNVTPKDTVMGLLPFAHIYGMTVVLINSLKSGAKLVTLPRFESIPYMQLLKHEGVTVNFVVPPVIGFLANHPIVDEYLPLPQLRDMPCGAAPLSSELACKAKARLGIDSVRQGYGMTEMSPVTHLAPVGTPKPGSIGRLLPGIVCKIMDVDTGHAVGPNKPGEMWLKGPNIMQGYLNDPQATNELIDNDGYLHTGDLAFIDEDGDFFIIDRLKDLMKVKGIQVAPAELEAMLLQMPGVEEAAVIGVPAPRAGDGQVPKAFIVPNKDFALADEAVKQFMAARMVDCKCPRFVSMVTSIPKSAAGKILRKQLRQQEGKTFA